MRFNRLGKLNFPFLSMFLGLLSVIGILGNLLSIFLIRKCRLRLGSIFNHILCCLLILHTLYMVTNMLTVASQWNNWVVLIVLFRYLLYPLKPLFFYSSTFLTVLMARERLKAIIHPWEYR